MRYPLDPLFTLTGWSMTRAREVAPCNSTEYRLRRMHGVTELAADRLATAAGYHPYQIWPEMRDHIAADVAAQLESRTTAVFTRLRESLSDVA